MSENKKAEAEELEAEQTVEEVEAEAVDAEDIPDERDEKIGKLEAELAAQKDRYMRLAAEYDNYRKRTAREKESLWQDAKADTILKFLPVYDNLSRAAAVEGDDDNPHKQGLIKIFQQYQEILKAVGVTEIDAQGQTFDPEKHNAVNHIDDEQYGENTVSQVFQPGFMMNGKVIRHAVVQVAN